MIVLAAEIADAGVALAAIPGTSLAGAVIGRSVAMLLAGLAVAVAARPATGTRVGLAGVALAAAAPLGVDVLASHAAAGSLAPISIALQAIHVLAVGLWLGGLLGLLLSVGRRPSPASGRAARRFSRLATAGIVVVAGTGLVRAASELRTLDALATTDYGHLVLAKVALLGVLAILGALNHFRHVHAAGRSLVGLRRAGTAELLVGATVVLLSAALVNVAPPAPVVAAGAEASPTPGPSAAPAATAPDQVVTGNDYGTSVRIRLEVSPGMTGFNAFRATVTDYDSGAPVSADGVTLRFVLPTRSDLGASRLDLAAEGAGIFGATGANLSLDGSWTVTVTVRRGGASVEIPLTVTVHAAAMVMPGMPGASPSALPGASPAPGPTIGVNAVPGLPTIYTVPLTAGRTVQVYADPGTPGPNEIHATFFDASGTELGVASATLAIGPTGGVVSPLLVQRLEAGHFVAVAELTATTYRLVITGLAPGGEALSTSLDIPVKP